MTDKNVRKVAGVLFGHVAVVSFSFAVLVGSLTFIAVTEPDLFGRLMYEDAWGEWATFHAFAIGGIVGLGGTVRHVRSLGQLPSQKHERALCTVLFCSSIFCLLVAGEEVSWGQRLFGVLPPDVIQELNYQQELNIHNILSYFISARFIFAIICFGYGVLLPVTAWYQQATSQTRTDSPQVTSVLAVTAPRLFMSPWFALAGTVYWIQPTMMSLEAAELFLGLALLTDIVLKCQQFSSNSGTSIGLSKWLLLAILTPLLLGAVSNPVIDRFVFGADEELVAQARQELADIAWDLQHAGAIHPEIPRHDRLFDSRLYSCVREDLIRFTNESRFYGTRLKSSLEKRESSRRTYFLDPWHNPYWICMKGYGRVHLYSFGPNRRLETLVLNEERVPDESDLKGDDIALWIDGLWSEAPPAVAADRDFTSSGSK